MTQFIANTQKQKLVSHLFAVGYISYLRVKQLTNNDQLAWAAFMAGSLHDIGKIDPSLQKWMHNPKRVSENIDGVHGKFNFNKHPRHNEISLVLFKVLFDFEKSSKLVNATLINFVKHVIFWHHAKPIRKDELKLQVDIVHLLSNTLSNDDMNKLCQDAISLINDINDTLKTYDENFGFELSGFEEITIDLKDAVQDVIIPIYKSYDNNKSIYTNIEENAKASLLRSVVVSSDVIISKLSAEELETNIKNKTLDKLLIESPCNKRLETALTECLKRFHSNVKNEDRNKKQQNVIEKLSKSKYIRVLMGAPGTGKNLVSIGWAAKTGAKKIIWICPRKEVCNNTFQELSATEYLSTANIEILTGDVAEISSNGILSETAPENVFSGDVVITTIDQIMSGLITHKKISILTHFLDSHIVFDEFHELFNLPGINLLFAELVACKKLLGGNAKTLLVSATPHFLYLEQWLEMCREDIVHLETFNTAKYKLSIMKYDDSKHSNHPFFQCYSDNVLLISNTASLAQESYAVTQEFETSILLHSKFPLDVRRCEFAKLYKSAGRNGDNKIKTIRSGPIIQASCNISVSDGMLRELTTIENFLQSNGRNNRFGTSSNTITNAVMVVPHSLNSNKCSSLKFLKSQHMGHSALAWYNFLEREMSSSAVPLKEIIDMYPKFYDDAESCKSVEKDMERMKEVSIKTINTGVFDPVSYPLKSNTVKGIAANSLRGKSVFVKMAVMKIINGQMIITEDYIGDDNNAITLPEDEISGYNNEDDDLFDFARKKQHVVLGKKKPYNKQELIKAAKFSETPVYLSFTEKDLGEKITAHENPIYYVVKNDKPIGFMRLAKIKEIL